MPVDRLQQRLHRTQDPQQMGMANPSRRPLSWLLSSLARKRALQAMAQHRGAPFMLQANLMGVGAFTQFEQPLGLMAPTLIPRLT